MARSWGRLLSGRSARWLGGGLGLVGGLAVLSFALFPFAQTSGSGSGQPVVPSVRILTGTAVTPATAATFYTAATTSTAGLCGSAMNATQFCSGGVVARVPELKMLARALRADANVANTAEAQATADRIYEYVRNTIDTEFLYGVHKGALGASIDHSGTAFDQAQLMVELLREAGITARYQQGAITLSAAQFTAWTGLNKASAACDLLATGGIPYQSTAGCGSGGVGDVTLAHVWVQADIGGSSYLFDPAYKSYQHKAGLGRTALHSAMGLSTGGAATAAASGMSQGSQSGVGYVAGLNGAQLATTLQGYSNGLLTRMGQTDLQGADLGDVIGGREILPATRPAGGWKQTAFAYTAAASATWIGNVPDGYRAKLRVVATRGVDPIFDTTFYVDEIYGRRLELASRAVAAGPPVGNPPSQPYNYIPQLKVDGVVLAEGTASGGTPVQVLDLLLTADHPFATDSGTYADSTVAKRANILLPVAIVHGWGQVSPALLSKWEGEQFEDAIAPETQVCNGADECEGQPPTPAGDLLRARIGASWLAQFSRAAELHAELADARVTHHHSMGVVTGDFGANYTIATSGGSEGALPSSPAGFVLMDETSVIDLETSFGLVSRTSDVLDRRAGIHALAASAATLEGSILEQLTQTPDAVSTARRFAWGNAPETGESPSLTSRRVYRYTDATMGGSAGSLVVAENLVTGRHQTCAGCFADDPIKQTYLDTFRGTLSTAIYDYSLAGFDVTASAEALLGPGNRHGTEYLIGVYPNGTAYPDYDYDRMPSRQNGGALIANKYDANGDPTQIAHVLTRWGGRIKGGGGPSVAQLRDVDTAAAADLMKDQFVDRSAAAGVDLMGGRASWSSPTLTSVGQGEFPHKLETKIELSGSAMRPATNFSDPNAPIEPVRSDVVTNWDGAVSVSSSGLEAMGASRIQAAAPTIAAFAALQDVYRAAPDNRREVIGALVSDWWASAMRFNVASISQGGSSEQHLNTRNGWVPAAGGGAQLTVSGTPQLIRPAYGLALRKGNPQQDESTTRSWKLDTLNISLRGAQGDVRTYGHWFLKRSPGGNEMNRWSGFRLNSWSFPAGTTLTLGYESAGSGVPVSVSSNLGLSLSLSAYGTAGSPGSGAMSCSYGSAYQVADAAGRQHKVDVRPRPARAIGQRSSGTCPVLQTYQPGDLTTPSLRYTYGATNLITEAEDAIAVRTSRPAHRFFAAEGYRGERIDPLGGRYSVERLQGGRIARTIDEVGRVTTTTSDGRGRMVSRAMAWGDTYAFQYDARDNLTQATHTPAADCGTDPWWCQTATIKAAYHPTWNTITQLTLPATADDPVERNWDFTYNAQGLLYTRTGPSVLNGATGTNAQPVWSTWYDAYGRVTRTQDPTGIESAQVWGAGGLPAWCLRTSTASSQAGGIVAVSTFGCNATGDVTSVTDPRGNTTTTTYDALRRKTLETGPAGTEIKTAWVYDLNGNVSEEKAWDSLAVAWRSTLTTYSATNLARTVTDPSGDTSRTCYDAMDRPSQVIDPEGRATLNEYNAAGQPTTVHRFYRAVSTDPTSCATMVVLPAGVTETRARRMEYNVGGLLAAEIDANGNRTELEYDGLGRQVRTLHADGTQAWSQFDERGQVMRRRHRSGRWTQVFRDALGRDYQVWEHDAGAGWPVGRHVRASYDLASRPKWREVSHQTGTVFDASMARDVRTYGYDAAGRVNQDEVKPLGSTSPQTHLFAYAYDAANNRTAITWPGAWTATYTYDAANRPLTVNFPTASGTATATYAHDSLSRRTGVTRKVGTTVGAPTTYAYEPDSDLSLLLHSFVAGSSLPTAGFSYMYDPAGKVTLTGIDQPVLEWSPPAGSVAYGAANNLNQISTVNGVALSFDTDGNMTSDGVNTYVFDRANRLISAATPAATATYVYDSDDRRTAKTVNGVTTRTLWSGADELAETDGNGVMLRRFIPGGTGAMDDRAAMVTASTNAVLWFHTDRQGSVIATSGPTGTVTESRAYSPHGEMITGLPPGGVFGYTGRQYDPETGLYQYRARYYSPRLGQFLSTDPIGTNDDPNLYGYVGLDPLNGTDPTGTECEKPNGICQTIVDFANGVTQAATNAVDNTVADARSLVTSTTNLVTGRGSMEDFNRVAVDGSMIAAAVLTDGGSAAARGASRGARAEAAAGAPRVGALPRPRSGAGSVPLAERAPSRRFSPAQRAERREAQGNQCANGCGTTIDQSNSRGHHIVRHADGGPTNVGNHAEVCVDCHVEIHRPR